MIDYLCFENKMDNRSNAIAFKIVHFVYITEMLVRLQMKAQHRFSTYRQHLNNNPAAFRIAFIFFQMESVN